MRTLAGEGEVPEKEVGGSPGRFMNVPMPLAEKIS